MKNVKKRWLRAGFFGCGLLWLIAGNGQAAGQGASDILAKLGLERAEAQESVLDALASGSVYSQRAFAAFKAIPGASRAAIVQAGLAWVKAYVQADEFKQAYRKLRDGGKPAPPSVRPSADEALKQQRADFEKQAAQMRASMAGMDAEMKKTMEETIRQMRAQMETMEKDPEQKKIMGQMAGMQHDEDQKQYAERLKVWDEKFPADFRVLLKRRINDFLAASAGVDFAAALQPRDGKMIFARPEYEAKGPEWKLCFRAGREATGSARAFAKAWLAELEKK
jgi:hypothetical protein